MDRWKELREGKTSDQLVDVLLNEISGGAGEEAGGAEYFDPQVLMNSISKLDFKNYPWISQVQVCKLKSGKCQE